MGDSRGGGRLKILMDTNILLSMAEGIDVLSKIEEKLETKPEYIVIKPVYDELLRLIKTARPSLSRKARLALKIVVEECSIVNYDYDETREVDDLILEYASKNKIPVATNDKELRRKLRKSGIPQIYLRDRNIIETDLSDYMVM